MNKYQITSIAVAVLFLLSLCVLLVSDKYIASEQDNEINDDIDDITDYNTTVIVEFFINAYECKDCDEAEELIENEVLTDPYLRDNITIISYKISDFPNEYVENAEKLESYGIWGTPSIVIKNLSSNKISKLTTAQIKTDDYLENELRKHVSGNYSIESKKTNPVIDFFGSKIDLNVFSLPLLTIVLGGIDSVNPCSFFVLLFLLSLLIYTKSRKRMIFIGSIFVFMSGFIYFLLMLAVGSIIRYVGMLALIFAIAGIIAIVFGGLNIKDFFFLKKGPSASISDEKKKGLYKQIRKIIKIRSFPSLFIASIIFAVSANTVDLACSFNLPVIYTTVLSSYNLANFEYISYIFFYNIIYVIPLIVIVSIMVISLGKWKLSEFQGRILKLFSGLMIFSLGEILLINPGILDNFLVALGLLAVCISLTYVISFIYKKQEKSI